MIKGRDNTRALDKLAELAILAFGGNGKEQQNKFWSETITTSVIRSFTDAEWLTLVKDFRETVSKHSINAAVIGFSLSKEQSAMFTKGDLGRLLDSAFGAGTTTASVDGWTLEECTTLKGAKSIHIDGDEFIDRLMLCRRPTPPATLRLQQPKKGGGRKRVQRDDEPSLSPPAKRRTPRARRVERRGRAMTRRGEGKFFRRRPPNTRSSGRVL